MGLLDTVGSYKLKANDWAGEVAFGNSVRFSDNARGTVNRYRHRVTSDPDYAPASRAEVRELEENGFLGLGRPYSDDLVTDVESAFVEAIESDETSGVRGDGECGGKVYSKYIIDADRNAPELYELLTDDVLQMVAAYFDSHFCLETKFSDSHVAAWRNVHHYDHEPDVPIREKLGSGNWHCDRNPPDRLKLFVCLSDVDEDCGPFHILTRSETRKMIREHGYSNSKRSDLGAPNDFVEEVAGNVTRLTGVKGTAAFANTVDCLHRAGLPEEGRHRDLVQFEFKASSTPIREQLSQIT